MALAHIMTLPEHRTTVARTAGSRPFHVELARSPEECLAPWQELEETGDASPFQTRAWLLPWYRILAPHFAATPLLVTVRDAGTGRPLMLLPLCRRRERGMQIIEFADLGVSDYNAPILAADFAPTEIEMQAIWRDVCAALPRADLMRLDKVPALVLGRPNPLAGLRGLHRMSYSCWGVHLPRERAAYDQNTLTSTFRKELRRKRRRIEGRGPATFMRAATVDQGKLILAALTEQRQARFDELGRSNVLADPVFSRFYEAVIFDNWAEQFGTLMALEADGDIVATLFCLKHRTSLYLIMSSFEAQRWKSCSPGNLIIDSAITSLIEGGMTYFDFTIGNEPYKRDFGATEQVLFYGKRPLSLIGLPLSLAGKLKAMLRDRLRRTRTPPTD